jgi:hypothetical protein
MYALHNATICGTGLICAGAGGIAGRLSAHILCSEQKSGPRDPAVESLYYARKLFSVSIVAMLIMLSISRVSVSDSGSFVMVAASSNDKGAVESHVFLYALGTQTSHVTIDGVFCVHCWIIT